MTDRSRLGPDERAEDIARMRDEEFDLVAVGRALLSDAEWGNKVQDGRENDIVAFTPAAMAEL